MTEMLSVLGEEEKALVTRLSLTPGLTLRTLTKA